MAGAFFYFQAVITIAVYFKQIFTKYLFCTMYISINICLIQTACLLNFRKQTYANNSNIRNHSKLHITECLYEANIHCLARCCVKIPLVYEIYQ